MPKKWARLCHRVPALVDESQVGLVDERRGLQRVPGPLAAQVAVRQEVELPLDQRHEPLERGAITLRPGKEKTRHVVSGVAYGHEDT